MLNAEARHRLFRRCLHFGRNMMIRPDADRAEEAREHEFPAADIARALRHEIVADDAQVRAKIEDIPIVLAQDAEARFGL